MAITSLNKRGYAYTFYIGLMDFANPTTLLKVNPTITAGDFKISKDGGAFTNLTNLPTVTPAGGTAVQISLTATEMTCDKAVILCSHGSIWVDQLINIRNGAQTIDDVQPRNQRVF